MTREEARKYILSWVNRKYVPNKQMTIDVGEAVDKIYDDFESRRCESCKHNNTCEMQQVLRDGVVNPSFLRDFGCNKYEEKKDD